LIESYLALSYVLPERIVTVKSHNRKSISAVQIPEEFTV